MRHLRPKRSGQHFCWRTPEFNIKPRIYNKLCVLTTGVMACVIYGLNGAASMSWHMSLKAKRSASMQHFWDVLTFTMNVSTAGSVGVGHSKCICFKIIHVIYAC